MKLEELQTRLAETTRVLDRRLGARDSILAQTEGLKLEIESLKLDLLTTEKAIRVLQGYGEDMQAMLTARIEDIVTSGLRAVFQDPGLTFKMTYSKSKTGDVKKTPTIDLSVEYMCDGVPVQGSLKSSFGGGLAVVTAVILNIVVVLHMQPRIRPILIMDEPLAALSPEYEGASELESGYRDRLATFLRGLVDETDLQLIMVSHETQYERVATHAYRFGGGIGKLPTVRRIKSKDES